MNAGLAGLLGGFIGDSVSTPNPDYDINKPIGPGNYPYNTPGFGTKVFHPEVAQDENARNLADYNANIANKVKLDIGGQNTAKVLGIKGQQLTSATDPATAFLATGENPSNTGVYNADVMSARDAAGLPVKEAGLESAETTAARTLLPGQTTAESLRNKVAAQAFQRQAIANPILSKTFQTQAETGLTEAQLQQALENIKSKNRPVLEKTEQQELENALYTQTHPEVGSLFYRDPYTGQLVRNPVAPGLEQTIYGKLQPAGAIPTISLGNGLHIAPTANAPEPTKSSTKETKPAVRPTLGSISLPSAGITDSLNSLPSRYVGNSNLLVSEAQELYSKLRSDYSGNSMMGSQERKQAEARLQEIMSGLSPEQQSQVRR